MNVFEQLVVNSQIESAENRVRAEHNEIESKKIFGKKYYMSYDSSNFIRMVKEFRVAAQ
jgi:hypothetical protein